MEQIVGFEYNSKTIRVSKLSKSKSGLSLSKCKLKKDSYLFCKNECQLIIEINKLGDQIIIRDDSFQPIF